MKNTQKKKLNKIRCETEPSNSLEFNTNSKKQEFLYSHKSSLEILLGVIKKAQISYLTNISSKNDKKLNKKNLKELLSETYENLDSMLKEQKTKINYLELQLSKQKSFIQDHLFFEGKNGKNKSKKYEFQNLKNEIEQLKNLNFQAKNDIRFLDYKIIKTENDLQIDLSKINMYRDIKEINCEQPKYYPIITRILYRENIETKKHFKFVVSAKQYQNNEIERVHQNLEQLKHFIYNKNHGYDNNYIKSEDIIPEDSKEYTKSITLNNLNKTLNETINKLMNANNINTNIYNMDNEEGFKSDNSSSDSIGENIRNINKKEEKKLNNYINLNMNINLNINFDKIYNYTDNIKYNTDREVKSQEKISPGTKGKKIFGSTGSLPYLIIKSINEETKSTNNNIKKDEIYNSKNQSDISKGITSEKFNKLFK